MEENEATTLEKIANIDACIDAMEEEDLATWVKDNSDYVGQISSYVDAAKECKRLKTAWLHGLAP